MTTNLVYEKDSNGIELKRVDKDGLPEMIVSPEMAIRYFSIPPKQFLFPKGSSPSEISKHCLDSTYTLEQMITLRNGDYFKLLGELQFAFVSFLLGHLYDAFEFWLDMVRILCLAHRATEKMPDLYLAFIRVAHFQLKQTDEAVFADVVENRSFVYQFMKQFLMSIRQSQVRPDLAKRAAKFSAYLKKTFKWDVDDDEEPEDEKPVIVENID